MRGCRLNSKVVRLRRMRNYGFQSETTYFVKSGFECEMKGD